MNCVTRPDSFYLRTEPVEFKVVQTRGAYNKRVMTVTAGAVHALYRASEQMCARQGLSAVDLGVAMSRALNSEKFLQLMDEYAASENDFIEAAKQDQTPDPQYNCYAGEDN